MAAADLIIRQHDRLWLRASWAGAATVLALVAAGFSSDPTDDDAPDNPPPARQSHVNDPTVYRLVFGVGSDTEATQKVEAFLSQKIMLIERICGLTVAQKQTLQLAGRGDNKRLLNRVAEMGLALQVAKSDDRVEELHQQARILGRQIGSGLSRDLLFVKSLEKTLTTVQLVRCQPLRVAFAAGGTVQPWLNKSVDVLEVRLTGTAFADDGLAHLSEFPGVQYLALDNTQITDAGLVHLQRLTDMHTLNLSNTRITDAGLAQLKGMSNLKELYLANTQVTDIGLADLQGLDRLNLLCLEKTRVTDAGLEHLGRLTRLSFLMLAQTGVTDSGLEHLRACTKMEFLWLADTEVTDAGLVHLQVLLSLQDLRLGGTRVTDAGLAHLKGMTSLGILTLDKTKVTGGGIADLQRALPDLTIATKTTVGASSRKVP